MRLYKMAISVFFYCEIYIISGGVFLKKIYDSGEPYYGPPALLTMLVELNRMTLVSTS
jgi:hypothetical protein